MSLILNGFTNLVYAESVLNFSRPVDRLSGDFGRQEFHSLCRLELSFGDSAVDVAVVSQFLTLSNKS